MKFLFEHIILVALLICLLISNNSTAKESPQIDALISNDSISFDLAYQICGGCDESFDKSVCDFSGDICTELLASLDLDYTYLGCLNDRTDTKLTEANIQDIAKLADYLFRDSKQLTCDDLAFLTNSQILDGVSITTLTEVISELFEKVEATTATK